MEPRGLYDLIRYLSRGTHLHIGVLFFGRFGNALCRIPHAHTIHSAPVCTAMKGVGAGFRRCFRCRNLALQKALTEKKPFGGFCACGVYEYTHPVLMGEEVAAVIFIGNIYEKEGSARLLRRLGEKRDLIETMEHSMGGEDCVALSVLLESYIRMLFAHSGAEGEAEDSLIENIKSYISENLEYGAELSRIAAVFHYNKTYLGRIFKQAVGMSISDYVNGRRLALAEELLLLHPRAPIIEIAGKCGFSSVTYFNRRFKAAFGKTPTEYRADAKKSN